MAECKSFCWESDVRLNMKIKIKPINGYQMCPFCGENAEYAGISSGHIFPAINTGQIYICRECGYQGSFIMEVNDLDNIDIKSYIT
ncbi:hypothetical protein METP2_03505 [Methanosarcinales archaeon]|nr:hypothetical protein METP2_03505 [Methanosarcinales archaeon]